ncbi:HTTM domain-containing protein [Leifsonia sp. NCR5]|uniref:HTTM domain-containing protein n=1 Tax=Leifsonia sp. NCR5 TaxID=1978342 RepID=UPI000A18F686|nr:HTTM domain-containing protein [Leifsonia sp. NCR5]
MNRIIRSWSQIVARLTTEPRALFGVALARIGVGVAQLSLYISDYGSRHDLFGQGRLYPGQLASEPRSINLYAMVPPERVWFEFVFHVGLLCCVLLVLGVGGRVMVLATWITSWSLWVSNPMVIDGGDNLAMIVLPLLALARSMDRLALRAIIPIATSKIARRINASWPMVLIHNAAVGAIMVQISLVYFLSGMYKAQGPMWVDGTALYYILRTPEYFFPPLTPLVLASDEALVFGTYAAMVMLIAFPFLVLTRKTRRVAVAAMMLFHFGIALFMGLTSFALMMVACDCVFVSRDLERLCQRLRRAITGAWSSAMKRRSIVDAQ